MREKTISAIAVSAALLFSLVCFGKVLCADEGEPALESIPTTIDSLSADEKATSHDEKTENSEGYLDYKEEIVPRQSVFGVLLRLVLSMVAIVVLIYGTVYLLRHFAKRGNEKPENERLIQVIDRINLDTKRSVYIVKVIDRLMILGVGSENVEMLGEIRDESVVESVKSNDFSFHLGSIFSRLHSR